MAIFYNTRSCLFSWIVLVLLFSKLGKGYSNINRSTFDLIALALHRDIKFMFERPQQINVDAIFGMNLADAHVTAVLENKNTLFPSEKIRKILSVTSKLCKKARHDGKEILLSSGFEKLIRPEIWNHTILWLRNDLGEKSRINSRLTRTEASRLIYQGTPTESQSSRCFHELLNVKDENCQVSKECTDILMRNDFTRGYPLTHRLLYVQAAIALNCAQFSTPSFKALKRTYCIAILQDLGDVDAANFPSSSRDLAMEQIVLCGMEGYMEFVSAHYANLILSWSNPHGCYSAFGQKKRRKSRSTSLMDYGCDNHASGVAAASLSLLVRAAVENN